MVYLIYFAQINIWGKTLHFQIYIGCSLVLFHFCRVLKEPSLSVIDIRLNSFQSDKLRWLLNTMKYAFDFMFWLFFFFLVRGMDPMASDMLNKSPILGCSCSPFIMNVNICVYRLPTRGQGIWAMGSEGRLKETGISASYGLYSVRGFPLCCLLIVCLQDYFWTV